MAAAADVDGARLDLAQAVAALNRGERDVLLLYA